MEIMKLNSICCAFFMFLATCCVKAQENEASDDASYDISEKRAMLISKFGSLPLITYDGHEISFDEYLRLQPSQIGTKLGYGGNIAKSYFGEIGEKGVLCLYSKENYKPVFDFDVVDEHTIRPTVFYTCDIPAEFPGGDNLMQKYIIENCNVPDSFYNTKIEGSVHVTCYIDELGKIYNYKLEKIVLSEPTVVTIHEMHNDGIVHVITPEYYAKALRMEKYAMDVVESLPEFIPAKCFLHNVKYAKSIIVPFIKI